MFEVAVATELFSPFDVRKEFFAIFLNGGEGCEVVEDVRPNWAEIGVNIEVFAALKESTHDHVAHAEVHIGVFTEAVFP